MILFVVLTFCCVRAEATYAVQYQIFALTNAATSGEMSSLVDINGDGLVDWVTAYGGPGGANQQVAMWLNTGCEFVPAASWTTYCNTSHVALGRQSVLTPEELAFMYRVPVFDVRNWIKSGEMAAVLTSQGWRVHNDAAKAFFAEGNSQETAKTLQVVKNVVSLEEAAVYLDVDVVDVQQLVDAGRLRALKIGTKLRIHVKSIDSLFD